MTGPFPPQPLPHPQTLALHGGSYRADPASRAVAVPIYQTTSYQFADTAHAARLFALEDVGFTYSRINNPTLDILEQRLAVLEGGVAGLTLATGAAATLVSVLTLAAAGDNIVVGGATTARRLDSILGRYGIAVRTAGEAPAAFAAATDGRSRAYWVEALSADGLSVFPIAEAASVGRDLGLPLIVDNTALPLVSQPLRQGAAIVLYAAAGLLGGHGVSDGGVLIDGGDFPWERHADRFPGLAAGDSSYHGAVWTEVSGKLGFAGAAYLLAARARLLRDLGAPLSPQDGFNLLQGLETLPLRLRQQQDSAARLAAWLATHPAVRQVVYPGMGIRLDVELAGGAIRAGQVAAALGLFTPVAVPEDVAGFGGTRSLVAGTPAGRLRLAAGLEHADDLIADLTAALAAA